jgi:hypothetical protein
MKSIRLGNASKFLSGFVMASFFCSITTYASGAEPGHTRHDATSFGAQFVGDSSKFSIPMSAYWDASRNPLGAFQRLETPTPAPTATHIPPRESVSATATGQVVGCGQIQLDYPQRVPGMNGNETAAKAQSLFSDPRFDQLDEPTRARLRGEWTALDLWQARLTSAGAALSSEYQGILARVQALEALGCQLKAKEGEIGPRYNNFKKTCHGELDPGTIAWCDNEKGWLHNAIQEQDNLINEIKSQIASFNPVAEAWSTTADAWFADLASWEEKAGNFNERLSETLAQATSGNQVSIHIQLDGQSGAGTRVAEVRGVNVTRQRALQMAEELRAKGNLALKNRDKAGFNDAVDRQKRRLTGLGPGDFGISYPESFGPDGNHRVDVEIKGHYPFGDQ